MILHDAGSDGVGTWNVNRSQLDVLRGWFGSLARGVLQRRIERHAPQLVRAPRDRLESTGQLDTIADRPLAGDWPHALRACDVRRDDAHDASWPRQGAELFAQHWD